MSTLPASDSASVQRIAAARMQKILDPNHPLCREDIVWALNYVKRKLVEQDEALRRLSPERVLHNFRYFAEVSLLLHRSSSQSQESDRLRSYLAEAAYGLWEPTASSIKSSATAPPTSTESSANLANTSRAAHTDSTETTNAEP
ncbi:methyltransferase [Paenibacillus sp. 481]|uniref:methyltransferase n=1 Tax=Paenibacillus sp. 481 TaxID=2835869 RepID=UPI001E4EBF0D|nr:methyltransferase [Paenibacillus sp. 481]